VAIVRHCDFSPRGWLCLASSEEAEPGACDEVTLAAQHGQRIEVWSRSKIRAEFGFQSEYLGRFIPGDGTQRRVGARAWMPSRRPPRPAGSRRRTPAWRRRSRDSSHEEDGEGLDRQHS
jgi:hypothetical protein